MFCDWCDEDIDGLAFTIPKGTIYARDLHYHFACYSQRHEALQAKREYDAGMHIPHEQARKEKYGA